MKIRTPFEGWTKQAFNERYGDDGAYCAIGYLGSRRAYGFIREELTACCERVARYIRANYKLPRYYRHPKEGLWDMRTHRDSDGYDVAPLVYANNVLKITPERFKAIDEHMQIMEALAAIDLNSSDTVGAPEETTAPKLSSRS